MKQLPEPKNPNELWCGEYEIAGVFSEAQAKQPGGLVPLSLDQKWSTISAESEALSPTQR
jgi:hypothetical protein